MLDDNFWRCDWGDGVDKQLILKECGKHEQEDVYFPGAGRLEFRTSGRLRFVPPAREEPLPRWSSAPHATATAQAFVPASTSSLLCSRRTPPRVRETTSVMSIHTGEASRECCRLRGRPSASSREPPIACRWQELEQSGRPPIEAVDLDDHHSKCGGRFFCPTFQPQNLPPDLRVENERRVTPRRHQGPIRRPRLRLVPSH